MRTLSLTVLLLAAIPASNVPQLVTAVRVVDRPFVQQALPEDRTVIRIDAAALLEVSDNPELMASEPRYEHPLLVVHSGIEPKRASHDGLDPPAIE